MERCKRSGLFTPPPWIDDYSGSRHAQMPERPVRVPVGAAAPDFSLESPGRGTLQLAEFRHRDQVILVFMRAFG
jgi:hypothetical protein